MRKKVDIAHDYGKQIAQKLFHEFKNNPDYQGSNFTWLGMADHVASIAATQTGLNLYSKNKKLLHQCETVAQEAAKAHFLELIKEHGLSS